MAYDRIEQTDGNTYYILERTITQDSISPGVPPNTLDMRRVHKALIGTPAWTDDGFIWAQGGPRIGQWVFDTEPDVVAVERLDAYMVTPVYVARTPTLAEQFDALATVDEKLNFLRDALL